MPLHVFPPSSFTQEVLVNLFMPQALLNLRSDFILYSRDSIMHTNVMLIPPKEAF